jgi:hypothetical protein
VARRKQALVLTAPEWMPLETEIYHRAKASTGASKLACVDLQRALQDGRLRSASRHIVGDKDELAELDSSAWRDTFKLTELMVLGGPHGAAPAGVLYRRDTERLHVMPRKERSFDGTWYFFGRRDDVDKLYPAATPSKQQPDRRGRPLKYEWHDICGQIARRCIDPKTRRVQVPKSETKLVADMLDWCRTQYDEEPPRSDMHEAVKRICAPLRGV